MLALALRRDHADGIPWNEMAVLTLTHNDATYIREQLSTRDIPHRDLATWDADGAGFSVVSPSSEFTSTLALLGAPIDQHFNSRELSA